VWAGFTLVAGGALLGLWAVHCLVELSLVNPRYTVFRMVLTIAIFRWPASCWGAPARADGHRMTGPR